MLAKKMAYPTHSLSKSLVKIFFSTGIAIAKNFAKASVKRDPCSINVLMVNLR